MTLFTAWIRSNTRSNTCGVCLDDVVRKTPRPGVIVQIIFPDDLALNAVSSTLLTNDIRLCKSPFSSAIGGSIFISGSVLYSLSSSLLAVWCSTDKLCERVICSLSLAVSNDSFVEPKRRDNCTRAVVWLLTWRYRRRTVWP